MKVISGQLVKLGSGTVSLNQAGKSFFKFETIEIGDTILQKLRTARSVADYIHEGLGTNVTLYIQGKLLLGVKLANGKIYYWKRSLIAPVLMIIPAIAGGLTVATITQNGFFGFLGFAAVYGLAAKSEVSHLVSQSKLAAEGGIGLKS